MRASEPSQPYTQPIEPMPLGFKLMPCDALPDDVVMMASERSAAMLDLRTGELRTIERHTQTQGGGEDG